MTDHTLKTIQPFFTDIKEGRKTFEVRFNDRKFKVGDYITFREYSETPKIYTETLNARVTYILDDPRYCKEGFVVFGFELVQCLLWTKYHLSEFMGGPN